MGTGRREALRARLSQPPAAGAGPARFSADRLPSPITPALRDRLVALSDARDGLDPKVLMKVGDGITVDENAPGCFAGDDVYPMALGLRGLPGYGLYRDGDARAGEYLLVVTAD